MVPRVAHPWCKGQIRLAKRSDIAIHPTFVINESRITLVGSLRSLIDEYLAIFTLIRGWDIGVRIRRFWTCWFRAGFRIRTRWVWWSLRWYWTLAFLSSWVFRRIKWRLKFSFLSRDRGRGSFRFPFRSFRRRISSWRVPSSFALNERRQDSSEITNY